MSVKSWIVMAMIVGVLGLGVEIPTPTLAEEVSQLSQQQKLAKAENSFNSIARVTIIKIPQ